MHSAVAGDIHVPLTRTMSRAVSRKSELPPLDEADRCLLDNIDEGGDGSSRRIASDARRMSKGRVGDPYAENLPAVGMPCAS